MVPSLQEFSNVTLVGYVLTGDGKRESEEVAADIDTYWQWHERGSGMGLDGIFVDEVTCNGEHLDYYEELYGQIKAKTWKSGQPGSLPKLSYIGFVVLNPGCAPWHDGYYSIADLVIVFEQTYDKFHHDRSPHLQPRLTNPHVLDGTRIVRPHSDQK